MLKLFFSDLAPETTLENVRAMRELYERKRDQLCALEATAETVRPGATLTLEIDLGVTGWPIEWCGSTERRLSAEGEPADEE